jgi:phosphoribosylformimino-5-aminoimidazole carboxamide ribotide isomerase
MELIPAIDLLGGRVVRLTRGSFDAVTDYGDDPVALARGWADAGARRIHVVDLDAAREGRARQSATIRRIIGAVDVPCQVAGGIRGEADVAAAFEAGADRVVLGSALIGDAALAGSLIGRHGPERVVAALDVRDGQALGDGWLAAARATDAFGHAVSLAKAGMRWLAVTAISRDGGLEGPDQDLLAAVRAAVPEASIIASGGIGSLADIRDLARQGYAAAIVGRALYDGAFTLPEALAAAAGKDEPPTMAR